MSKFQRKLNVVCSAMNTECDSFTLGVQNEYEDNNDPITFTAIRHTY